MPAAGRVAVSPAQLGMSAEAASQLAREAQAAEAADVARAAADAEDAQRAWDAALEAARQRGNVKMGAYPAFHRVSAAREALATAEQREAYVHTLRDVPSARRFAAADEAWVVEALAELREQRLRREALRKEAAAKAKAEPKAEAEAGEGASAEAARAGAGGAAAATGPVPLPGMPGAQSVEFAPDVSEEASAYLEQLHSGAASVDEVVATLKRFQPSDVPREQQVRRRVPPPMAASSDRRRSDAARARASDRRR